MSKKKKYSKNVTIERMNQVIAMWLYGKGKIIRGENVLGDKYWLLRVGKKEILPYQTTFDSNGNCLMECMKKIMKLGYWYAVYPTESGEWEGKGKKQKYVTKEKYYCAFTSGGFGRMGYGDKLNKDFLKDTPELAMQYSIYRLITNGLEY